MLHVLTPIPDIHGKFTPMQQTLLLEKNSHFSKLYSGWYDAILFSKCYILSDRHYSEHGNSDQR